MEAPLYVIDAFTSQPFSGNPAGVCFLDRDLADEKYQLIAREVNLSETAFVRPVVPDENFETASNFFLRWFTPSTEVPLCGYATLATALVIFNILGNRNSELQFETKSGPLICEKTKCNEIAMDFPSYEAEKLTNLTDLQVTKVSAMNKLIKEIVPNASIVDAIYYASEIKMLLIVLKESCHRSDLESIEPNFQEMVQFDPSSSLVRCAIVTLLGSSQNGCSNYDFVSRIFAPWAGIDEDPVTGSAHCVLGPYWSKRLNKIDLKAFQCSKRGGEIRIKLKPEEKRLKLIGRAVQTFKGTIAIP